LRINRIRQLHMTTIKESLGWFRLVCLLMTAAAVERRPGADLILKALARIGASRIEQVRSALRAFAMAVGGGLGFEEGEGAVRSRHGSTEGVSA
jgi:hypothetical protein